MKGMFLIILACFLWALDALIRYPLISKGVSPLQIVFFEHLILTIIFLPVGIKLVGRILNSKVSHLLYFIIIGALGSAIATVAFSKAFLYLNPSVIILLQKFQPVFAVLLARFILGESISKRFLIWAFLAMLGGIIISFGEIKNGISSISLADEALAGYLLVFVSVLFWATSTVFGKKLTVVGFDHKEIMGGRFIIGFITLSFLVYFSPIPLTFDLNNLSKIFFMVMISGLFAMYFYYKGLKSVEAKLASLLELFFPFAAVIVNWCFLDASLNLTQIIGGCLLLISSSVIQLRKH